MSRLHDRLLLLCKQHHRCPLGLALWERIHPALRQDMAPRNPSPKRATAWLGILEKDAWDIAADWDHDQEPRQAMKRLVRLGGFLRPAKKLTTCERRWQEMKS